MEGIIGGNGSEGFIFLLIWWVAVYIVIPGMRNDLDLYRKNMDRFNSLLVITYSSY
ncbi:hypothetical protein BDZ91DRAFT_748344 [Kalaharituber pfeilii]|nr:hypothetical protein BDZ91DRAFT_748344 [Kalaharituber pfeilii]